jgi:myo-inositol-1-phosphate synthase
VRIGVWLVGAYGNVAAVTMTGAAALKRGLARPVGMVTERKEFSRLDLCEPSDLVFGGYDIREGTPYASAREFARRTLAVPLEMVEALREDLEGWGRHMRSGTVRHAGPAILPLASSQVRGASARGRALVERMIGDLKAFQTKARLDRVVVVNLASAEEEAPGMTRVRSLAALEHLLDQDRPVPPSVLYAWSAFEAGCAYINFTSSVGSAVPALEALARERHLPHMGRDAKTGETLMKSALAPMFAARHLKVLSWEGHNLLGNLDGAVLQDPAHQKAKLSHKDATLRRILGADLHARVRIDYVPSLDDWKTAWDFIHFEGFLGTRMSLQFTWQGCDSILAAPLVLDLVRLAELSLRRGEGGVMRHCAAFFKVPQGVRVQALHRQDGMLLSYARRASHREGSVNKVHARSPS